MRNWTLTPFDVTDMTAYIWGVLCMCSTYIVLYRHLIYLTVCFYKFLTIKATWWLSTGLFNGRERRSTQNAWFLHSRLKDMSRDVHRQNTGKSQTISTGMYSCTVLLFFICNMFLFVCLQLEEQCILCRGIFDLFRAENVLSYPMSQLRI